jgi:two-component system sensor kinase FixL
LILGSVVSERSRLSSELIKSHDKLRESQSALIQASRVSLVSEMATALAHELNQPLSSVRNYVRAIQRMLERPRVDRERVRDVIGQAVVQIDSASSLIQQTRRFLRRGEVHLERADLRQIIMMSIELVRPELRRTSIILKTDLPDYIPAVSANAIQIQQVIVNLLRNARDSIVDSASDLREIRISASTRGRPGFVEVAVSDSGPGIADEIRPRLFRPFQSSKPEGLGLGLSLCSSIVSAHGGELWLDEQVNGRTRFIFTLKFHQSSAFAT